MSARHFINDPTHLIHTALHAITLTYPGVALDADNKIIYRRPRWLRPWKPWSRRNPRSRVMTPLSATATAASA